MFIFVDFFNAFQALWSICSSMVACIDGCVYVHAGDSSMYTCICSRALKCICSYMLIQIASRVHVCLRACIHAYVLAHCGTYIIHVFKRAYVHRESSRIHTRARTHMDTYAHIHTNICTCIHTCTLVHTWVNAQMWDLVRKAMYSETRWNQKPLFGVTRRDHSPNSLSCKGFLRGFQRRLGHCCRAAVHSRQSVCYQVGAHFICKYTEKVNTGLRKPSKCRGP